jgi:hypothetical protein
LPAQRTFMVQMHAAADVAPRRIVGRVEHVVSGQALCFHILEELLTFMAQALSSRETAPEETP